MDCSAEQFGNKNGDKHSQRYIYIRIDRLNFLFKNLVGQERFCLLFHHCISIFLKFLRHDLVQVILFWPQLWYTIEHGPIHTENNFQWPWDHKCSPASINFLILFVIFLFYSKICRLQLVWIKFCFLLLNSDIFCLLQHLEHITK